MAVYVDDMCRPFKRMKMCHMIADTQAELFAMAARIGLSETYVQSRGTYREHFDVSLKMRAKAVEEGAKQITQRELAVIVRNRMGRYGSLVPY